MPHSCCLGVHKASNVRWGCGRAAFIDPGVSGAPLGVCDVRQQGWNHRTYTEQPGLLAGALTPLLLRFEPLSPAMAS